MLGTESHTAIQGYSELFKVIISVPNRRWGSTGDPPVPFGDSPDGTEATPQVNRNASFAKTPADSVRRTSWRSGARDM